MPLSGRSFDHSGAGDVIVHRFPLLFRNAQICQWAQIAIAKFSLQTVVGIGMGIVKQHGPIEEQLLPTQALPT